MTRARDLAAFVSNADGDIKFDTDTLFIDSSANRVGIGTTTPSESLHIANANDAVALLESTGSDATDDANIQLKTTNGTFTIQNDRSIGTSGALTVAGNTSNNIVVDHNSGNVGIGHSSPTALLHITSDSTSNLNQFLIESTNAGTASGPDLTTYRNSSSPADNDNLGAVWFYGNNSAAEQILYAGIIGQAEDVTDATEDGRLQFFGMSGGSTETFAYISSNGISPSGETTAANFLGDYEEGTWTPNVKDITFQTASGIYTKIGRMVTCIGILTNATSTGNGDSRIDNLPFTVGSNLGNTSLEGFGSFQYLNNLGVDVSGIHLTPFQGTDEALIKKVPAAGIATGAAMPALDISEIDVSNVDIRFNLTYFV